MPSKGRQTIYNRQLVRRGSFMHDTTKSKSMRCQQGIGRVPGGCPKSALSNHVTSVCWILCNAKESFHRPSIIGFLRSEDAYSKLVTSMRFEFALEPKFQVCRAHRLCVLA